VPDGLPIFPLVLTLEDWLIFSPQVDERLNKDVRRLLADARISEKVLEETPYTIASAREFEIANQVIARVGIFPVMSKKTKPERRRWSLLPFIQSDFSKEMGHVNWRLFDDDWTKLMPTKPDG